MNVVSFHGGEHDCVVCFYVNGIYKIVELERTMQKRYYGLEGGLRDLQRLDKGKVFNNLTEIQKAIKKEGFGDIVFDICAHGFVASRLVPLIPLFVKAKEYVRWVHHESHAACSFYQSNFERAIVVTLDGFGDGTSFSVYDFSRERHLLIDIEHGKPKNVIMLYTHLSAYVYDISRREAVTDSYMLDRRCTGKFMGYAGYGNFDEVFVNKIKEILTTPAITRGSDEIGEIKRKLGEIGIEKPIKDFALATKFAASVQKALEETVMEDLVPFLETNDLPICISGGGALNILLNSLVKKQVGNRLVFVPPNPNDSGVSLGALFLSLKPLKVPDLTYCGVGFDESEAFEKMAKMEKWGVVHTPKLVAELLSQGKIIGVMRGDSEIGPRALGNRSFLCDPSFPEMKQILNSKIKFREWFRPFAPVVLEEDANVYFEMLVESSPYMSFNMEVRKDWREMLSAITHVDGSARVHTVNASQNEWLVSVLKEFKKLKGFSVLLNTSFNSRGKPLCNTIKEALEILKETPLDYVIINDRLVAKSDTPLSGGCTEPL